jgi:hypothetical protein
MKTEDMATTVEDISTSAEVEKARPRTAVSQLLNAIYARPLDEMRFASDGGAGFRVMVASKRGLRERAYALAHRIYRTCGYVEDQEGLLICPYDARPDTFTLLIADDSGNDIATASLVFDSACDGLPCDEIYHDDLVDLRKRHRRLVEVTRLCINEKIRSRDVLVRLFNLLFIQAVNIRDCTDCVIEVTPQHANYYRRLLSFEQLGPQRLCPRVGVEGVMLHLRREVYERELGRSRSSDGAVLASDRSLFRYFLPLDQERDAVRFLLSQC